MHSKRDRSEHFADSISSPRAHTSTSPRPIQSSTTTPTESEILTHQFNLNQLKIDFANKRKIEEGGQAEVFVTKAWCPVRNLCNNAEILTHAFPSSKEVKVVLKRLKVTDSADGFSAHQEASMHNLRNVMRMIGTATHNGYVYLVLPYCSTFLEATIPNILALKARNPVVHSVVLLRIAIDTLEALTDLHNIGRLHRDVKPSNISFRPESGSIILADMESSKLVTDPECENTTDVTIVYLHPEILIGKIKTPSFGQDIYALGKSLLRLFNQEEYQKFEERCSQTSVLLTCKYIESEYITQISDSQSQVSLPQLPPEQIESVEEIENMIFQALCAMTNMNIAAIPDTTSLLSYFNKLLIQLINLDVKNTLFKQVERFILEAFCGCSAASKDEGELQETAHEEVLNDTPTISSNNFFPRILTAKPDSNFSPSPRNLMQELE